MKKRQGFVSNSSTSSFVILGIPFNDGAYTEEQIEDFECDKGYMILYEGGECGVSETIIGIYIADGDDTCFGGESMSLIELNEKAEKLVYEFGVNLSEVKIYSGVRMC